VSTDHIAGQAPGRFDRRDFLKASLVPAAALPLVSLRPATSDAAPAEKSSSDAPPEIVDTNVHLFEWPFRRLKYGQTATLVAKLRKHRVKEAWAGSFQALLHKNLDAANTRLAEECRRHGEFLLRPFGSVCPVWPGWEEDLRRCHEVYKMPGIRLYPSFHNYGLDRPEITALLGAAAERGLIVQIAIEMEDPRVHHPAINVPTADVRPLAGTLKKVPAARVQLLNGVTALQNPRVSELVAETRVAFDIANFEGTGALGRILDGKFGPAKSQVPLERLLFGSHAPFFPYEAALLRLFESPLEREQMMAIMQKNALRLAAGDRR
jgi:predicted TIM-barrel fold metal-dependent hydrolase